MFILYSFTVNCNEDVIYSIRYFNCTGEDQSNHHPFHAQSFIANNELKLIENIYRKFHNQNLFDFDLSEELLTDSQILHNLFNKAR